MKSITSTGREADYAVRNNGTHDITNSAHRYHASAALFRYYGAHEIIIFIGRPGNSTLQGHSSLGQFLDLDLFQLAVNKGGRAVEQVHAGGTVRHKRPVGHHHGRSQLQGNFTGVDYRIVRCNQVLVAVKAQTADKLNSTSQGGGHD